MKLTQLMFIVKPVLAFVVIAALVAGAYFTREAWLPLIHPNEHAEPREAGGEGETIGSSDKVIVTEQAQKNLRLSAAQLKAQSVWKSIEVPGMVVDRPGRSDRNVVAPAAGVVSRVVHSPGDAVRPGDTLFTLRLTSESLHQTQADLFKAGQDIKLAQAQRKRLAQAEGAIPEARIIEVDNTLTRLRVAVAAHRRELANRGLTPEQIDEAAEGNFVNRITIAVPSPSSNVKPLATSSNSAPAPTFEMQELKVELGQQVQAGQTLCLLANHQALAIEGRAFRDETPLLERSAREGWEVKVDFQESHGAEWPKLKQAFRIRQLANTIDPVTRTFSFLIPLENQSHVVEDGERTQMLWRFRPGQKVRIRVLVEQIKNVFVLPPDAVTRDGVESFIFTQNVNTFERKAVRVVLRERDRVLVDNDGSLETYARGKEVWTISAVALNAAAQLNRMARAGSGALPSGYHMHADGSLHKNQD